MRKQSLLSCALKQSCDTTACTMHQTSHDAYLRHTTNCRSPQQAPLPKASSPAAASGAGLPRGRTASGVGWPRDREWNVVHGGAPPSPSTALLNTIPGYSTHTGNYMRAVAPWGTPQSRVGRPAFHANLNYLGRLPCLRTCLCPCPSSQLHAHCVSVGIQACAWGASP